MAGRLRHDPNHRQSHRPAASDQGRRRPRRQGAGGLRPRRGAGHPVVRRQGGLGAGWHRELFALRHRGRCPSLHRCARRQRRRELPTGTGRFGMTAELSERVVGAAVPLPAVVGPRQSALALRPWRSRAVRVASVVAAIGLWQLLTAGKVRLLLRFDTLPTVTPIATALHRRLGTYEYWL